MKKIIATLGPSTFDQKIVEKLDESGVDIFRINLSHTEIQDYQKLTEKISSWTKKPVCPDTEGAQIRTGKIINDKNIFLLKKSDFVELVDMDNYNNFNKQIPLSIKSPEKIIKQGDLLKIDFDSAIVQAIKINQKSVICRVITEGEIGSNKGISSDRQYIIPPLSEKDISLMKVANELKQNTIFLSFCSDANDILKLRDYFDYEINVIAKIENELGINNLDQICSKANGILIDRGDLSREVPIEKIPFVQSYIIEKSKENSTPVYVATNLMENMISNSKPTRAEVNDIVSSLKTGADGLVLAAETAIGKYPVECVRIMSRIIDEVDNENKYLELKNNSHEFVNYLLDPPANKIIEPHGGKLIQNFEENFDSNKLNELSELSVNEMIKSDIIQICNGTYSPIEKFMNLEETFSVLNNNRLLNNEVWTLPIIFQISKEEKNNLSENELITIKDKKSNKVFALMNITSIEKINNLDEMASKWYGTTNAKHPGVSRFLQNGDYIICGKPFMLKGQKYISSYSPFDLTTKQTREIINHNGWYNVIGFHTRNILHKGHEFIQKYAIEESNADAIFISPVSGIKKPQDYKTEVIIECYEKAIKENLFNYCPVLIGTFNTYSRYAGPREAVFTALCRKNFGCNYFIIGRDHTGLGKFYGGKESQNIFNDIPDVGINIIKVDEVVYSKVKKKHVFKNKLNNKNNDSFESISASLIREMLKSGKPIPDWLMNKKISEFLVKKIKNNESILIS